MKYIIALVVAMVVLFSIPSKTTYVRAEPQEWSGTVQEAIAYHATQYGASVSDMLKVAKCESGFKPSAVNYHDGGKGNHSVGVFQYQEATFNRFTKLLGEDLDYYSYFDQSKVTAYIFAKYPQYKSHWSCSRVL